METLKSIDVKVTYSVKLSDLQVPEDVYNDLVGLYHMDVYRISPDTLNDMECNVCEWLGDNIKEQDHYEIAYEITDIETQEQ